MKIADEIKRMVTVREAAQAYGLAPNRSGFIKCPFHSGDNTASLKLYDGDRGWHCYGCNKNGSVIDFVMELFGLNFRQAVLRINTDFRLGLSDKAPSAAARSKALEGRRQALREQEAMEAKFRSMADEKWYWQEIVNAFPPVRTGNDVWYHPFWVEGIRRLPYIEYWLEEFIMCGGDKG